MTREELAQRVRERAVLHGDFVLRSGRRSKVYVDKYRFETDPSLLAPIADELDAMRLQLAPGAVRIAGPELGAIPLATALSLRSGLPSLLVRSTAKEHGTGNRLEGLFAAGETILLVEDVVTSGGAALDAVGALREAGLTVETAFCVLNREEGGVEALAARGVRLTALFDRGDLGLDLAGDPA